MTNACSFSDGILMLTYDPRILFAAVSHRECFQHPGFRIDRSILHLLALIPLQISGNTANLCSSLWGPR